MCVDRCIGAHRFPFASTVMRRRYLRGLALLASDTLYLINGTMSPAIAQNRVERGGIKQAQQLLREVAERSRAR
eukprot:SAG25_NODE_4521_length_798_cov_0.901288_1_plen_73_part_10